jgi:hypothetical protein
MPIEVEVDIYSGRPNPRVALPPATVAELRRRFDALPLAAAGAAGPRKGLGYRGLRITGDAVPGGGEIVVSAGSVTRRADPDRGLERWLVEAMVGAAPPRACRCGSGPSVWPPVAVASTAVGCFIEPCRTPGIDCDASHRQLTSEKASISAQRI